MSSTTSLVQHVDYLILNKSSGIQRREAILTIIHFKAGRGRIRALNDKRIMPDKFALFVHLQSLDTINAAPPRLSPVLGPPQAEMSAADATARRAPSSDAVQASARRFNSEVSGRSCIYTQQFARKLASLRKTLSSAPFRAR